MQALQRWCCRQQEDDMIQSNDEKMPELFAALAKAQGEFAPIAKNRSVTIQPKEGRAYHFRYADLEAILAAVRPALAANGLALVQPVDDRDGAKLVTALMHASGAALVSATQIPKIGDRDPKQYGALLTYLRRYMVTALLGVAADDDLDENGNHSDFETTTAAAPAAAPAPARVARKTAAAPAPSQEGAPAADAGDLVGVGEVAWLKNKAAAVGADLDKLLADAGGLVLDKLTKGDFAGLKAKLRALE
jgi:hypothetical protein